MLALLSDRFSPRVPKSALVAGVVAEPCRCGHGLDSHEHWRAGTDCATCGCDRYRTVARRRRASF
jgi:hypothetical protein